MTKFDTTRDRTALRSGVVLALTAQLIWGIFPAYLKLLKPTPAVDIVAHRVVWSFAFLILLTIASRRFKYDVLPKWSDFARVWTDRKMLLALLGAAALIVCNWLGFVVAIALDRTLDASVGYYICPQIVVLLGVVFEKERLSAMQWFAFACSAIGVLTMAASTAGIPWLGLVVAFSFGFYALFKKRIQCPALTSLTFETGVALIPALAYFVYRITAGASVAENVQPGVLGPQLLMALLVFSGVATIVPLACYVNSVKRIPLSLAGLLQFVGPTMHFLLSVFVFEESFETPQLIGIVMVWIGVGFYLRGIRTRGS